MAYSCNISKMFRKAINRIATEIEIENQQFDNGQTDIAIC